MRINPFVMCWHSICSGFDCINYFQAWTSFSLSAPNKILGDSLCVSGAFLYGVSNVAEEFVVKKFDRTEFLAMLGLFGSFINGVQL